MTQNTLSLRGLPPSVSGWASEYGQAGRIELSSNWQRTGLSLGSVEPRPVWLGADLVERDRDGMDGGTLSESRRAPVIDFQADLSRTALPTQALDIDGMISRLEEAGFGRAICDARADYMRDACLDPTPSLKTLRARCGLTQAKLATLVGTSQSRIARIEAKREDMSFTFARRLAGALGVSLDNLAAAGDV